jgi:hypothetical protein
MTMRIWANAAIGTAADRDVRLAEDDLPPGLRDAFGAGRTRRHGRHHSSLGMAFQTDRGGRPVGHEHLHGKGRDGSETLFAHVVVGKDEGFRRADAGTDGNRQPVGVHLGAARVVPHPSTKHGRHLLDVAQPAQFDSGQLAVEVLEKVSADADREVVLLHEWIFERADSALSVKQ